EGDGDGGHRHGRFGERAERGAAAASGALWLIGLLMELTGVGSSGMHTAVFVVAGICGGAFTLAEAVASIRNRRFEIDFLMLVAAAGAWTLGKWAEGALLLALFSMGHALEGFALGRARRSIAALGALAPEVATVRDGAVERVVAVGDLRAGDVVVVKPHERIAADGFVVAGHSSVDQAVLTGESIPVDKQPVADAVLAAAAPDSV
ncbi:MAG TPA: hypothetical protein PLV68_13515, partial [Ilumatobacteraceae bacterium]|nr:hypothetical protein [Ilumatobacteraceae bacterium]